jgi:hypothetical protein
VSRLHGLGVHDEGSARAASCSYLKTNPFSKLAKKCYIKEQNILSSSVSLNSASAFSFLSDSRLRGLSGMPREIVMRTVLSLLLHHRNLNPFQPCSAFAQPAQARLIFGPVIPSYHSQPPPARSHPQTVIPIYLSACKMSTDRKASTSHLDEELPGMFFSEAMNPFNTSACSWYARIRLYLEDQQFRQLR